MTINSVYMRNYGNVEEQSLVFSKGLTLFSGNNGEGKSTVLKCLKLLLFNQAVGKFSDYIRWGTDSFSISTEIEHLGKRLRISFDYGDGKSRREVVNLDTEEVYLNSAALNYLSDFLDTKRALASIVSSENEIDLITTSPSERREYLKRIYDLNFKDQLSIIATNREKAELEVTNTTSMIGALEKQTFEMLTMERPPFNKEIYNEKMQRLESVSSEETLLLQKKKDIDSNKEKIENIDFELFKIEKSLKNKDIQAEQYRTQIAENESKLDNLTIDTSSIEERKANEVKELEVQSKMITSQLDELNKSILELKEPVRTFEQKDKFEMLEPLHDLKYSLRTYKEQQETFASGECPTCHQSVDSSFLSEVTASIVATEEKIDNLEKEIDEYNKLSDEFDDEVNRYNRKKEEDSRRKFTLESKLESFKKELETSDEKYNLELKMANSNFIHEKERLEDKISSDENSLLLIHTNKKSIYESKENYEKQLIELKKSIQGIDDIDKKLLDARLTIDTLNSEIKKYESVVSANVERKKMNKIQEAKKLDTENKIKELKESLVKAQETVALNIFSNSVLSKEFPSFVISRMVDSLKKNVNDFLSKVYPDYELDIVESKSSIRVLYGPNQTDVKLASGFEQQIFSFAWKYALGRIQNYSMLILDEVDSAASEENSGKFYSTLAKMDEYFKQVFVVTHKQDIKDMLATDYDAAVFDVVNGTYEKIS